MTEKEGTFSGPGGLSIYFRYWIPNEQPKALILVVHGAGEHCSRYQHFAQFMVNNGYVVAALDHPGHGKSDGTPGFVESFDDYLDALALLHKRVTQEFPSLPQILLGHSMGGLISSCYLLEHQGEFAGCVLSGPAIKTELEPGFVQTWLIRLLSKFAPKAGVLALDPAGVSRDPKEVEAYVNDPLVHHGKMSARKVSELFRSMQHVQENVAKIELPMLLLHGSEDAMTSPEGSRFLHEHISSANKTLKIYPGLYHEIFNEPEREEVFADVLGWCNQRVGA